MHPVEKKAREISLDMVAAKPVRVARTLHCQVRPNSHGARPVRLIMTMIKWIRTSRLSIKNSLSPSDLAPHCCVELQVFGVQGSKDTLG